MTTATLKVIGTTDDVTACECCGRADLKGTVVLEDDLGNVRYYGCDCAAKATGQKGKDIAKDARAADKAKAEAKAREEQVRRNQQQAAYDAWLIRTFGDTRSDIERYRRYKSEVA